jgi:HK97 family phage prohead protease
MELQIFDGLFEVRAVNAERRSVDAVMSTGTLDRYGEVIEPNSFKARLASFLKNPTLLRDHDHTRQIGHWENVTVSDKELAGTAIFATTPDADEIWQLHRDGHRKAFSVGFIPHAWEMREVALEQNAAKKRVRVYTECELLECSSVAVPANPDALQRLLRSVARDADGGNDADVFHRLLMEALGQLPLAKQTDIEAAIAQDRVAFRGALLDDIKTLIADPFGPLQSELRAAFADAARRDHDDDEHPHCGAESTDKSHPAIDYMFSKK